MTQQIEQDLSPNENGEYSEQQKKIIFEEISCLRQMMEGFDYGYGDRRNTKVFKR